MPQLARAYGLAQFRLSAGCHVLALALVLGACSGADENVATTSTKAPPTEWDRGELNPSEDQLEEVMEARREDAEALLARLGVADVPDVEPERFINLSEYGTVMAQCMRESGFPATARSDGGVDFGDVDSSQAQAQSTAFVACGFRFPVDPVYDLPLTDRELEALHTHLVEVTKVCLEEYGHVLAPAPSLETFKADYRAGRPWSPFTELLSGGAVLTHEQEEEILNACSQSPWDG